MPCRCHPGIGTAQVPAPAAMPAYLPSAAIAGCDPVAARHGPGTVLVRQRSLQMNRERQPTAAVLCFCSLRTQCAQDSVLRACGASSFRRVVIVRMRGRRNVSASSGGASHAVLGSFLCAWHGAIAILPWRPRRPSSSVARRRRSRWRNGDWALATHRLMHGRAVHAGDSPTQRSALDACERMVPLLPLPSRPADSRSARSAVCIVNQRCVLR